jgi:hypothetical protein
MIAPGVSGKHKGDWEQAISKMDSALLQMLILHYDLDFASV